jgi:hypothetical protein
LFVTVVLAVVTSTVVVIAFGAAAAAGVVVTMFEESKVSTNRSPAVTANGEVVIALTVKSSSKVISLTSP